MAVDYAHQNGRVHGQLKPTNILIDKRNTSRNVMGEPIVTDFGMDKLLGIAVSNTGGWRIGTPLYTAPEQIMGSPADERSDIYSLGIMLYEICTGTPPFPGNNAATIMMQQVNTLPASPALINPGLPPALITIIMRCIAKEPCARFPTASSLVEDLAQAIRPKEKEDSNIRIPVRSEEHTSELQSHSDLVCRLLLEKKRMLGRAQDPSPGPGSRGLVARRGYRHAVPTPPRLRNSLLLLR